MINLDKIWFQKNEPTDKHVVWFYDGVIKVFNNGTWQEYGSSSELKDKVDSLDKEIGDILRQLGSSGGITELKVGDTQETLTKNLEALKKVSKEDSFLIDIDYGFGTGSWNANSGGKAFITTATGVHVNYTIDKNGKLTKGLEIDTSKLNSDLFIIVSELPEASKADRSKIYCVKSTSNSVQALEAKKAITLESKDNKAIALNNEVSTQNNEVSTQAETAPDTLNRYIEYIVIQEDDGIFDWEKVGEFKAEPDLSGYAKLSGANFTGDVKLNDSAGSENNLFWMHSIINRNPFNAWIRSYDGGSKNLVYESTGRRINVGDEESFIFTLEDGTQVTKSIRVVSTTTSEAGA